MQRLCCRSPSPRTAAVQRRGRHRQPGRSAARKSSPWAAGPETGTIAGDGRQRRSCCLQRRWPRRAAAPSASARRCRDGADGRRPRSTGPVSTMRPAYITATRSAISATTPRLWVTNSMPMPRSCLQRGQQVEDLRLDGDVERGGRLVGDQQRRIAGERHGDGRALAHPAREFMRILPRAAAGSGMPTSGEQPHRLRPHRRCDRPRWMRIGSAICSPMV